MNGIALKNGSLSQDYHYHYTIIHNTIIKHLNETTDKSKSTLKVPTALFTKQILKHSFTNFPVQKTKSPNVLNLS